jgi:DNA-directed RNA polymerase specialized sigma24 family protein
MEQGTVKWWKMQDAPILTAATYLSQGIFATVDWDGTYKRLCVLADYVAKKVPDVFDGVSIDDLINDVFVLFFESPNQLGWRPEEGELSRFLMGVLKHKVLDHMRRQAKTVGSFDDPNFMQQFKFSSNAFMTNPVFTTDNDLLETISGDTQLEDLVSAVELVDSGRNMNQLFAEALNTTPDDIANRKRRLKRKLEK